jgi:predicted small metal-binding protein
MSIPEPSVHWSFACRDLGFGCEWRLRAASVDEVKVRFFEHARCAHSVSQPSAEWSGRVESASHRT